MAQAGTGYLSHTLRVFDVGKYGLKRMVADHYADVFRHQTQPNPDAGPDAPADVPRWSEAQAVAKGNRRGDLANTFLYSGLAMFWSWMEGRQLDACSRDAVAAEKGKDPENVWFGDYLTSKNTIVRDEAWGQVRLGCMRLLVTTAQMFYHAGIKLVDENVLGKIGHQLDERISPDPLPPEKQHGLRPDNNVNLTYASMFLYWTVETFGLDRLLSGQAPLASKFGVSKSAHYEVAKLVERVDPEFNDTTSADIGFNDVFTILQRTQRQRVRNGHERPEKIDKNAVRPLINYIVALHNMPFDETPGAKNVIENPNGEKIEVAEKFRISHIVYLIGGARLSDKDVAGSIAEIDRVASKGLRGIGKENGGHYSGGAGARSDCKGECEHEVRAPVAATAKAEAPVRSATREEPPPAPTRTRTLPPSPFGLRLVDGPLTERFVADSVAVERRM